ncbi:MAG TPA: enoyl-CoA hydratase [Pseudonocardiaceae bacterium]
MSAADIIVEVNDRIAVVTVSDPARRNALSPELSLRLADRVRELGEDESVNVLVVTGAAPAFCAGADLSQLGAGADPAEREHGLRAIYAGFLAVADSPLPTIAAVGGAAVGAGLNLALACDVRLAGPGARFDARFLKLGLHPGGGMTWLAQRAVGPQTARAMALFGEILDAGEALRLGLVHRVADDPVAAARELAATAAVTDRDLVLATKRTMRATAGPIEHSDAVHLELGPQVESVGSARFAERLAATRTRR